MNVLNLLVGLNSVILIFLVVNVFKPFFGSYAAKKGENLATKEDIAHLTKIAEGIKAEISDKVWDRQRQWEMRRDAAFGVIQVLGQLDNALLELYAACCIPDFGNNFTNNNRLEKQANWNTLAATFDGKRFLADAFISKAFSKSLIDCSFEMQKVAKELMLGNLEPYLATQEKRLDQVDTVYATVRKELGLES
jgi:hypothetical protein